MSYKKAPPILPYKVLLCKAARLFAGRHASYTIAFMLLACRWQDPRARL
jgi:hypothetical protein